MAAIYAHLDMVHEDNNQPRQPLAAYQTAVKPDRIPPEVEHAKQRIKAYAKQSGRTLTRLRGKRDRVDRPHPRGQLS